MFLEMTALIFLKCLLRNLGLMKLKFQKRSELKFVRRTIPGAIVTLADSERPHYPTTGGGDFDFIRIKFPCGVKLPVVNFTTC
jgi:hypothetical protein